MHAPLPLIGAEQYLDPSVTLGQGDPTQHYSSRFETMMQDVREDIVSEYDVPPIVLYANALECVREMSGTAKTSQDQMDTARELQARLGHVANVLGLPDDHFSIDTSGNPLTVVEGRGEHTILPTHFEGGAYFNDPHADHQLDFAPEEIPRIHMGQYVRMGGRVGFNAGGDVHLGKGVWFAPDSYALCQDHSGYERPSVGSRTVNATRLPGLHVEDYAMIGRKSVVKWDVGYVGKAAVVALLSSVGREVGDYSIVGDRDKILGYQGYRAALMEYGDPSFEQMLQISDWEQVKSDWIERYKQYMAEGVNTAVLPEVSETIHNLRGNKKATMLDMNPGIGNNLLEASRAGISATGVSRTRELTPIILQRAEQERTHNIRLRGGVDTTALPYPNGTYDILRNKKVGFDLVVNVQCDPRVAEDTRCQQLAEAARVASPDGKILFGYTEAADAAPIVRYGTQYGGLRLTHNTVRSDQAGQQHSLLLFQKTQA